MVSTQYALQCTPESKKVKNWLCDLHFFCAPCVTAWISKLISTWTSQTKKKLLSLSLVLLSSNDYLPFPQSMAFLLSFTILPTYLLTLKYIPMWNFYQNQQLNMHVPVSNSMSSILTHTVAHSTRPSYRPKVNNQPLKKFLSLAVSWVKVVKNGKILTFKVNFLCQKLSEPF